MDVWIWVVLGCVAALVVAVAWWKRRGRRAYVIDHVRVEIHPAAAVEDQTFEQTWRVAISMTNISRRPRTLPVLAERATVRAGRRSYLASVYLDADVIEVNPDAVAVAWVECVLPRDSVPSGIRAQVLYGRRGPRGVRLVLPSFQVRARSLRRHRPTRAVAGLSVKPG